MLEGVRDQAKIGLADMAKQMNAVGQGKANGSDDGLRAEPRSARCGFSFGPTPASARPLKKLDLAALFGEAAGK